MARSHFTADRSLWGLKVRREHKDLHGNAAERAPEVDEVLLADAGADAQFRQWLIAA